MTEMSGATRAPALAALMASEPRRRPKFLVFQRRSEAAGLTDDVDMSTVAAPAPAATAEEGEDEGDEAVAAAEGDNAKAAGEVVVIGSFMAHIRREVGDGGRSRG
jgi:hypothetical protein